MAEKTFNFNIIGTVDELKAYQSGTVVNARILDGVTSLHPYIFYNMTSLESVDFNQIEIIPADCCRGCTNLTQALFSTHTTQIGEYAFYNCIKFEDTELPHTLTDIGQYAFYLAGSYYSRRTHTFTMIDDVGIHTTIRSYAFYQSHLSEISAYTNDIGSQAFCTCRSLTDVNLEIHGSIGTAAFYTCEFVENFTISPNSVITNLDNQAFDHLAAATSPSLRNIAPFDFRNSTFTSVADSVWGYNTYDGVIYFPSTLTTIGGNFLSNATGNWKLYFNSVPTVSSSAYLRNDSGTTFTVKYFFPYELIDQALSTTNWSTHASQIIGYGTGFEVGTTLPQYTRTSGVAITWYSDETLTTQITTSSGVTDIYYCVVGSTRMVWIINPIIAIDAAVVISDGINTYTAGDFIPVNTSITITASPTNPNKTVINYFVINDVNYNISSVSIIMDQNLNISIGYWDGVMPAYDPVLQNNSWDIIKQISVIGRIPSEWNVGDTKTLTYDNQTYTARLVDKTGKFKRTADGSTAYLYFEFTEIATDYPQWGTTADVSSSPLLQSLNPGGTRWEKLDSSLRESLEFVDVIVAHSGIEPGNIAPIPFKVFLAREKDIFTSTTRSSATEAAAITTDEYYQIHTSSSEHIKPVHGGTSSDHNWLISPHPDSGNNKVAILLSNGGKDWDPVTTGLRYGIRFAL